MFVLFIPEGTCVFSLSERVWVGEEGRCCCDVASYFGLLRLFLGKLGGGGETKLKRGI